MKYNCIAACAVCLNLYSAVALAQPAAASRTALPAPQAVLAQPASATQPSTPEVSNAQVEEARAHFQRGVELYQERNFEAALAEFSRAHELAANYRVLFNMGQVHVERHDSVAALKAFRRYLDEGGADVPAARREQVERDIVMLKQRIAELRVRCNVNDAEILVGDTAVGKTPLTEPVLVNAGVIHLTLRKTGYAPSSRTLTAVGAEKQELEFVLEPEQGNAGTANAAPAGTALPVIEERRNMTPFWIGLGTTVALAGGATVFGVLTGRADNRLDDALRTYPTKESEIEDARSELRRNALLTDVLAGGALVSAAVTIYFAVSPPTVHEARTARVGLRPYAGGTGLELSGNF
ncbi:MAG TPA: PEGA domain-containing protein [Polyangiaceae bacterium]|nr:PEGA domain-containing protein [Polyangiaceae bacterium]